MVNTSVLWQKYSFFLLPWLICLSPQVYNSIFTGRTTATCLSGRKPLTVFFSDIAGFTDLTDSLEPEDLSTILNAYLTEMSNIALQYGGTIDKFIGDSLMIFFGDPDTKGVVADALLCVQMAIEMRNKIKSFHKRFPETLSKPLQVRMGIHSGFCTVGSFGAENRLEYTIVGGTVNLASRLEGLSNTETILISSSTYAFIKDTIACEKGETVKVKGINTPVRTYLVIDSYEAIGSAKNKIIEEGDGFSVSIDLNVITAEKKSALIAQLSNTFQRQ